MGQEEIAADSRVIDVRVGLSVYQFTMRPAQDGCRYVVTWYQRDHFHAAGPAASRGAALNEAIALAHLLEKEPEPR